MFDSDILNLFKKRAFDLAGIYPGRVEVILNDEKLSQKMETFRITLICI